MNVHILDATGRLVSLSSLVDQSLAKAIKAVSARIDIPVNICLNHDPAHCNPELGIGGGAFSQTLLHIFLDADNPRIESSIKNEMTCVLAHEVHHCARMSSFGEDTTLADSLITEGLACQFESEFNGGQPPSFIPTSLAGAWFTHYVAMRGELQSAHFCFDTFFLGKSPDRFPKYAAYAVGYGLVGRYLLGSSQTAAQSFDVDTSEILKFAD